ncbi:hypothetical protein BDD30_3083 [Photorhabdus asymbiotica]|uniref:Uncharacterized protein n=1 Tax=Photorhabdus asymbiotica TaxID=291112 RepID=A0ABX9SMH0_9GAMM|nr:hypothetical protein BDD30_3083 [Photorhabdus asymbiotica]
MDIFEDILIYFSKSIGFNNVFNQGMNLLNHEKYE